MTSLVVAAPMKGWAAPLSEAPDPVFAQLMMGDGLLIDPLDATLHAPFDGEIVSLAQTGHALVIRADIGVEMLMHVGLETVALGGEGFIVHVVQGQRVRAGDRLLSFDLDLLAQRAKSLVTPIVLTNGERFNIVRRTEDRRVEVGDTLMVLDERSQQTSAEAGGGEARREVKVALEHGLHARPAALVARAAQAFKADVALLLNGRRANAKSPVSIMTLGVSKGDLLQIEARGGDAQAAVDAVAHAASAQEAPAAPIPRIPLPTRGGDLPGEISGVCASPGVAVGVAVKVLTPVIEVTEAGRGADAERASLEAARRAVRSRLEGGHGAEQQAIMSAHAALLDDPELAASAEALIRAGKSAGFAWRGAIGTQADALRALGSEYMADRVTDLRDLELQVLAALGGKAAAQEQILPERAIIIAEDLLPSQFNALDRARLAGICMAAGGATSHVAILAQSQGVPAIVAAGPRVLGIAEGARVVLDADSGVLRFARSAEEMAAAEAQVARRASAHNAALAAAIEPCVTADGARINIYANLGALSETAGAVTHGAEGCGLLRTEFLFMDRNAPPSEAEQRQTYQAIADALGGRPLTIRTLDAGADKPVAYMPMPAEKNPALGVRGLRASFRRPELLRAQLQAIIGVVPHGIARVLLPMVTDVTEIRAVRAMLAEIGGENVALGVMIETPAAAMLADQLAAEADFLSIGTNDLSQYALAMDREHTELATAIDALHPAVLRFVARSGEGARKHGVSLSICGATASDPHAAPLLIGLGADTLSAAPNAIPEIKARLRQVRLTDCQAAAQEALALPDARAVRRLIASRWSDA